MSKLVCLDPGHNNRSVNRSPDGTYYEWEFAQDVCDKAAAIIKLIPGLECIKTKEADTYPTSLEDRVITAHKAGAALFLSQHSNAYGDGKEWTLPNGFSVYRYPARNLKLAQIGLKWCRELLPLNDRGMREADFYVLRVPNMPSILFETGFHTNREDVEKLKTQEFRLLAARVLVKTTAEFLEVTLEEEDNSMNAKQHLVKAGDTLIGIARANGLSLTQLLSYNPHVDDPGIIYAEYGGDIIFLEQPSQYEAECAALKRELILCKLGTGAEEEIESLRKQLQTEKSRFETCLSRVKEHVEIGRQIASLSQRITE